MQSCSLWFNKDSRGPHPISLNDDQHRRLLRGLSDLLFKRPGPPQSSKPFVSLNGLTTLITRYHSSCQHDQGQNRATTFGRGLSGLRTCFVRTTTFLRPTFSALNNGSRGYTPIRKPIVGCFTCAIATVAAALSFVRQGPPSTRGSWSATGTRGSTAPPLPPCFTSTVSCTTEQQFRTQSPSIIMQNYLFKIVALKKLINKLSNIL